MLHRTTTPRIESRCPVLPHRVAQPLPTSTTIRPAATSPCTRREARPVEGTSTSSAGIGDGRSRVTLCRIGRRIQPSGCMGAVPLGTFGEVWPTVYPGSRPVVQMPSLRGIRRGRWPVRLRPQGLEGSVGEGAPGAKSVLSQTLMRKSGPNPSAQRVKIAPKIGEPSCSHQVV